jgi:hypothetical protein
VDETADIAAIKTATTRDMAQRGRCSQMSGAVVRALLYCNIISSVACVNCSKLGIRCLLVHAGGQCLQPKHVTVRYRNRQLGQCNRGCGVRVQ